MTDHSSGENNIESLAQRAKEVLDRVRSHTDDAERPSEKDFATTNRATEPSTEPVETSFEDLDTADLAVIDETAEVAEVAADDTTDETDVTADVTAGDTDVETSSGYIAALAASEGGEPTPTLDTDFESGLDLDADFGSGLAAETEPDLAAGLEETGIVDLGDDAVAGLEHETDMAMSTALVPTKTFDADSLRSDDADEDGRKFGCLIPLVLLGLIVLALVLFWGRLFGSDDDPVLISPTSDEVTTSSEALDAPDSSTDTDTTVTTESTTTTTTSTSTTTTSEAPPSVPETAWELLDAGNGTDQFASFGSAFGLQQVLEGLDGADTPDGFTVLAPSNDAISALTLEQLAGYAQDPSSAEALIGYHIVDQRLTPDLLLSAAGGQIESRVGLPIDVALDGDDVVLNGQARVALDALVAGNGNVLVIDTVLQPPTINSVIDLGEVQFEVISAIITPEGEAELQKAVAFFKENPDAKAVIEGHTDTDGPAEPNQRLSERRAEAVRTFLISQGIDGARLTAEGFGETRPIIVDGTEDKAASRRIELNIR